MKEPCFEVNRGTSATLSGVGHRSAWSVRRLAGLVTLGALGATLAAGCGSERPPTGAISANPVRPAGSASDAGDGTKPPGCGTADDGSQCDCVDVALYTDPPTMYFVLDRSGSMGLDDNWNKVRVVVAQIMRTIGPRANFGATMFPAASATDACVAGKEVLRISPGDPPSSGSDGPTTRALLAATNSPPSGGTPTAATLEAVKSRVNGGGGKRYVILATDGAPNCNVRTSCSADQCQDNIDSYGTCTPTGPNCCADNPGDCNDESSTVAQIAALRSLGAPTFVIGLPGAQRYSQTLDSMAVAGGNALGASPRYYAVTSSSQDAMFAALKQVAAKITGTCVFDLTAVPANTALVNVYIDEVVLPYEPVNGWTIDGTTVTLQGSTCAKVLAGDALDVRIIAGCPRVVPK